MESKAIHALKGRLNQLELQHNRCVSLVIAQLGEIDKLKKQVKALHIQISSFQEEDDSPLTENLSENFTNDKAEQILAQLKKQQRETKNVKIINN